MGIFIQTWGSPNNMQSQICMYTTHPNKAASCNINKNGQYWLSTSNNENCGLNVKSKKTASFLFFVNGFYVLPRVIIQFRNATKEHWKQYNVCMRVYYITAVHHRKTRIQRAMGQIISPIFQVQF